MRTTEPLAIDDIFRLLPPETCDLVTVYRMLATFESIGLVRRSFNAKGTAQYLHEPEDPVFFVVSQMTGRATRIPSEDTVLLQGALASAVAHLHASGYRDVVHSVQFFAD